MGFDPAPLCGADRNLVLSTELSADQHYQQLRPGRASGKMKINKTDI